jgi:hypothetical protein
MALDAPILKHGQHQIADIRALAASTWGSRASIGLIAQDDFLS